MWRFDILAADTLQARQVHTQFRIFQRITLVAVVIITFSGVMMSFQRLQALGAGLFASAGIVGLLGISAQKTIGNMISGIIIALTQPIRIDDVVVVETEWGRVEEIALTYVVIKIWNLRRLIVPLSYFLEKPFQNWKRVDANLLKSIILEADYTINVDNIRKRIKNYAKTY
jgi:small-conductance mechanosensitive channel